MADSSTPAGARDLVERQARYRASELRKAASGAERVHTVPPMSVAARAYATRLREAADLLERPIETEGGNSHG